MRHSLVLISLMVCAAAAEAPRKKPVIAPQPVIGGSIENVKPEWNVELLPGGSVRVIVDLSRFTMLTLATEVKAQVEFFDAGGKKLGTREFPVTDLSNPALFGGRKHGRDFDHGYPSAVRVVGKTLNCKLKRDAMVNKPSDYDPTKGKV